MTTLKTGSLFPTEVVTDIFTKVKGHSSLAKLAAQTPIPFAGTEQFIFNLDGNTFLYEIIILNLSNGDVF